MIAASTEGLQSLTQLWQPSRSSDVFFYRELRPLTGP